MLNENIRALRKERGLSQEELAERVNVVRQTVSKWEKGLSVPDAEMLTRLAKALETSTVTLLGEAIPESEAQETVASLAEKLARLNEAYTAQQERRRKNWRCVAIAILALALLTLLAEVGSLVYDWHTNRSLASDPNIIGGADAATQLYLTSEHPRYLSIGLSLTAGVAALCGLHRIRRQ